MATTNHYTGGQVTFTEAAAAATVTSTLPAPGTGLAWRIDSISFFATGAFTVWSVEVTENGGTSIYKAGGTTAVHPGILNQVVATKGADAPKVILTVTTSSACVLNVTATLVTAAA